MIPVMGMFRGLFLGSVLVWYSSSVWKTMDNYYNQEFKKYLQKEKQERRFPSQEVCRTLPEAPSAAAAAHDAVSDASEAGDRGGRGDEGAEALGANAAPENGASGGGGCTVAHDVKGVRGSGTWRRRAEDEDSGAQDDGDTCPALF